jgi:hypothetical protein
MSSTLQLARESVHDPQRAWKCFSGYDMDGRSFSEGLDGWVVARYACRYVDDICPELVASSPPPQGYLEDPVVACDAQMHALGNLAVPLRRVCPLTPVDATLEGRVRKLQGAASLENRLDQLLCLQWPGR